ATETAQRLAKQSAQIEEANENLRAEVRRSRAQLHSHNRKIYDLADGVIFRLSPGAAISIRDDLRRALNELGAHERAIRELDAILAIDPNNLTALGGRGDAYLMLGKAEESIADTKRYLAIKPDALRYANLATGEMMRRNYEAAVSAIR